MPARLPFDELPAALETDFRQDCRRWATSVEVRCRLPAANADRRTACVLRTRRSAGMPVQPGRGKALALPSLCPAPGAALAWRCHAPPLDALHAGPLPLLGRTD